MSCELDCKRRLPCENDLNKLKDLYKEKYARHAGRLVVRRLNKPESQKHPFYNDTRTKDRVYFDPVTIPIFGPFDGFERDLGYFGIDRKKALVFVAATPIMEDLGWTFKNGDLIVYQGVEHEVLKVGRKDDSYYDQYDYSFEINLATYIPNRGS
jgi:hypothetical protein